METRERVELALIPLAAAGAYVGTSLLPTSLPLGQVVLTCAALLLGQGLVRDLYLKYGAQTGQSCQLDPATGRALSLCMESTLGVLAILIGAALLFMGQGSRILCRGPVWPALVLGVGLGGFLIKDVVIDLRARRLRLEKDHRNVIFG